MRRILVYDADLHGVNQVTTYLSPFIVVDFDSFEGLYFLPFVMTLHYFSDKLFLLG